MWRSDALRVVLPEEPDYPGFTRVIWNRHAAEMTDLADADRALLMRVIWCVERVQRTALAPDKVNLASLGNVVPHLHWHVIPRFADDPHFPNPVWGERKREAPRATPADLEIQLREALSRRLGRGTE